MGRHKNVIAAIAALVLVAGALAMGFHMLGPLSDQRAITADERRVGDLRRISNRLRTSQASGLPDSLAGMEGGIAIPRDPLTNAPYEYYRGSGTSYRLCATFAFAGAGNDAQMPSFWDHPKGRHCYQLDAALPN